jgi:hypothetical protein
VIRGRVRMPTVRQRVALQVVPAVADNQHVDDETIESATRADLVLRRYRNGGWLAVAAGVVVPFVAAAGAYRGFRLWRSGRLRDGLPLLAAGLIVFAARLGLYASTGFHSAF